MRELAWEGCHNVRDLGGLPLAAGGETRYGVVVRADSLSHLTERGWEAALAYGVTRVVDLRFAEERAKEPSAQVGVEVVHISLFGERDPTVEARWVARSRAVRSARELHGGSYRYTLDRHAANVASAVTAAIDVDGCVAVHCFGGKDRTGIIAALLLSLAGVDDATIVADYQASDAGVERLLADWFAEAADEADREYRDRIRRSPAAAMLGTLAYVRERWGGAEEYLVASGVGSADLARFRRRISG